MCLSADKGNRRLPAERGAQRERVPVRIFDEPYEIAQEVAERVAALITARAREGRMAVLGLPSGSTPIGLYKHLVRMHLEEGLDFSSVVTFNLDELSLIHISEPTRPY